MLLKMQTTLHRFKQL